MIRKKKKFAYPKQMFEKQRILDENKLKEKYGLKNKKEIWKTEAKIKYFRNRAKSLITADQEQQGHFFDKLKMIGFKIMTISDVLALQTEDMLKRRLSTIVWQKGIAHTAKQARQLIVHKKITINDRVVNIPSYVVKVEEEGSINIRVKEKRKKVVEPIKENEGIKEQYSEKTDSIQETKEGNKEAKNGRES